MPRKASTGPRARRSPSKPAGIPEGSSPGGRAPPAETSEEIPALIAVLLETGKRLEELTAGEVDTVADRHGRPLLLRRAQEELRHTEVARQAAILNALPAHIALLDPRGLILSVNERWREFAVANGFREPGLGVGLNYLEVCDAAKGTDAASGREAAAGIRSVLAGVTGRFDVEYSCHSPDKERWFLMSAVPLVRAQPKGAVVMHFDVTAERGAEEALLESQARFRQMAEASSDVLFLESLDVSKILYVSPGFEVMVGRPCADAYANAQVWAESIHPDDREYAFAKYFGGGRTGYDYEFRLVRPDGQVRWIRTRGFPVLDAAGRLYRNAGVASDITESKLVSLQLKESERRFSEMMGNVELVSLMLDRELRITYCNEYLLRLTGWRQDEILGRNVFGFLIPPELEGLKEYFAKLLAGTAEAGHHENEILTRAGERRLIRWSNSFLRSPAGDVTGVASIGEDITQQRLAERRIARLNRVTTVLSSINSLLVRAGDRDELFREACRIAVEAGGFRMALIGVVDPRTGGLVSVTSAGKDEVLRALIETRLRSGESSTGSMIAEAISQKRAAVANDSQNDPRVLFARKYAEAGVRSLAVLPLIVGGAAVGAFALYALEGGFFQEDEMTLLTELAGDIAFAMDHIEKQDRLNYLAYYDVLTGLANRDLFLERVRQYLRSAVDGGHQLAVFLIDVERFRNINETFGRAAGDAALKQVAEVLTRLAGDAALLARVGGDQFAAVLPTVRRGGDVPRLLEKISAAFLDHPFRLNEAVFRLSARAGGALFPDDGADADTLYRNAEAALKRAKNGGERFLFYTQGMSEAAAGKLTMESQLRDALAKGEFVLHYQPKLNLASGRITGTEALIRWNDPRTGLVPPMRFIPILEETGLIHGVGTWALGRAIDDYLRWKGAGLPAVRVAVNVSPLQLRSRGFIDEIRQVVGRDPHAASGLELEITESLIMEDVKHSIATLQTIRALGVTIAIDDFGTGFSSLSYLSRLPVDTLKIDRSFVTDMSAGPQGLALVSTIINLAHSLKLGVVAEGVETEEQSRLLRLFGCDEVQGFLFSKPVPAELFESKFLVPPPG